MELFRINPEEVSGKLIKFLRTELEKTGLKGFVIGLSGGLDSAVSSTLAVDAVGADGVLAILMPYTSSSESSLTDAKNLSESLGIRSVTVDISPLAEGYFKSQHDMSELRTGNFLARMRMAVLYDMAAKNNALVLGTSNKSEALLGYGTLHGDAAWDINPLWDLYKTQVRDLARFLNVPKAILDKTPTADLWRGQTDEDELGFSYERIDRLLFLMVDSGYDTGQLLDEGFEKDEIERARKLVKRNQFKRSGPYVARLFEQYPGCGFVAPENW